MRKFPVVLAMLALSATSALAQIVKTTCTPSDKEFRKAVKTIMYRTNGHDITPKRMKAMEVTQSVINNFTNSDWRTYRRATAEEAAIMEQSGVPYFLHQSFEKVRKELSKTKVKEGTVAVWLLYNMGYIVKTPTATFAIDLYSKYTDRLLDVIDFGMITHAHGDHNNRAFTEGMAKRGKPVLAAFDIKDVEEMRVEDGGVYKFGDITVRVTIGDHNKKKLRNFVASYEVDCGANTNNTVIYHTGDSCDYKQLNPSGQVDIFIPHMRVGLNIQSAIDKFHPRHVFLSHLQELGHRITKWRWTFDDALKDKKRLKHDHLWIPCWGERVIYNRNDWK